MPNLRSYFFRIPERLWFLDRNKFYIYMKNVLEFMILKVFLWELSRHDRGWRVNVISKCRFGLERKFRMDDFDKN